MLKPISNVEIFALLPKLIGTSFIEIYRFYQSQLIDEKINS